MTYKQIFSPLLAVLLAVSILASSCSAFGEGGGDEAEESSNPTTTAPDYDPIQPAGGPQAVYPLQIAEEIFTMDLTSILNSELDLVGVNTPQDLVYKMVLGMYKMYRTALSIRQPEGATGSTKLPAINSIGELRAYLDSACFLRPIGDRPEDLSAVLRERDGQVWNRRDQLFYRFLLWAGYSFQFNRAVPTADIPNPAPEMKDLCGRASTPIL